VIDLISIADVFTVANAILGFCAVVSALEGRLDWSYTLIIMCVLVDGLDGLVARRFAKRWNLGDYLDIMADSASFGLAPAVILWLSFSRDGLGLPDVGIGLMGERVLLLVVGGTLIAAGVLRLARFCFEKGGGAMTFDGMPIPAAALMIALCLIVGVPGIIILALIVVASACMVSDFRWPKARGSPGSLTGVLAVVLVTTRIAAGYYPAIGGVAWTMAVLALFWTLMYVALGPVAAWFIESNRERVARALGISLAPPDDVAKGGPETEAEECAPPAGGGGDPK
jgi:CDP-diacylglycerol--serine O-phosphatidyltransferase